MSFYSRLVLALALMLSVTSQAATPTFSNITAKEFDEMSKELSANFLHHTVQGAAPLGQVFGFELGLIAGQTAVPHISDIVKRSGGADFPNLYHAGLFGVLTAPLGITGEIAITPKMSVSDLDLEKMSLAAKLSLNTDLLQMIPFNLAFRAFMSNAKFSYKQNNGGVAGTIENKNNSTGIQLLASPALPFIEPYAGIGYVTAKNDLSLSGTGNIFDTNYTSSKSADVSLNSTQYIVGVTGNLLLMNLGLEYSSAFGASTYTAKLAFGF